MSPSPDENVMAFDYGRKRIGVAVGQTVSRTASALRVLKVKAGKLPWTPIQSLVQEWSPDRFVVGCPRYADGREHPLHKEIAVFARQLRDRFARPVEMVDEHLSSYAAADESSANAVNLDAHAAKLILETWLAVPPGSLTS